MRAVSSLLLVIASAGWPASTQASPAASDELWIQLDTPHFTLFSNSTEENTRRIGTDLERLHGVLANLAASGEILSPLPTKIYVFRDDESFEPFKPAFGRGHDGRVTLAGYFRSAPLGNYVAINGDPGRRPSEAIYHEYLHYFARHNLPRVPLWLNEGLAEYYSTFETRGQRAYVGLVKERHLELLRRHGLMPTTELLQVERSSRLYRQGGERRGLFYAQAWLLVHYLLSDDDRADGMRRYLELRVEGAPSDEAFDAAFELSPLRLERQLERYLGAADFASFVAEATDGAGTIAPGPAQILDAAETRYQLGDLLLQLDRPEEAYELFREALRDRPTHGLAHAGVGQVHDRSNDLLGARAWLADAVAQAPEHYLTHFLQGDLLLRSVAEHVEGGGSAAGEDLRDLELARRSLERSRRLKSDFGPAYASLGATYLFDPQPSAAGVEALQRAVRLQPDRVDVVFNLVSLLARLGRFDEATRVIERVLILFDEPEVLGRARIVVTQHRLRLAAELIDAGDPEAGLAAAEQVLVDDDPGVRGALSGAAEEMVRIARHNLAVTLFDRAVRLARSGQRREALELVERVGSLSRDSELQASVRSLRRQLQRP